jgi:phage protein D/phage baseplate assembly protein gpV
MTEQPTFAPRAEVRIAGATLAADVSSQLMSLRYENSLDLADAFSLELYNAGNQLLDSALFDLGKTVEIYLGYGVDLEPMMLGEITSLEPSFPAGGPPTLRIGGYDKSYRLRHNQPDRPPYQYVTDSVIAAQIAGEAGLIPVVDPSLIGPHLDSLPQTCSDMAFLKERAAANFFDVYVRWDKLYFQMPRPQSEALVLEWGRNLINFEPRISSAGLAGIQVIRGYNQELAQTIVSFAMAGDLNPENLVERLGSAGLDLLTSLGRRALHEPAVKSPADAAVLAKSILQQIMEGLYEGTGSCIGMPGLRAGLYVTIEGVGKRFSGVYRLRKVTHTLDDSGYRTSFDISQQQGSNLLGRLRKPLQEERKPNKQERLPAVMVGVVRNNKESTASPTRTALGAVQVHIPGLSEHDESTWAPCVFSMAGKDRGMFALPAVNDQVLIAFENGDRARPYVIGSLWNNQQTPPATIDGTGVTSIVLRDKNGSEIRLDDKGSIVIETKAGSSVTLAKDGDITMETKDGNKTFSKLTLTKAGEARLETEETKDDNKTFSKLTLTKAGKAKLEVKGSKSAVLTLSEDGSVVLDAKGKMELKAGGATITMDAGKVDVS